jgi:elongation factor Ts
VPEDEVKRLTAEFTEQANGQKKPAEVVAKIVDGQVKKYLAEKCLMEQPFIKNPDQSIGDYVKDHAARLGENIVVRRFKRFVLGEA